MYFHNPGNFAVTGFCDQCLLSILDCHFSYVSLSEERNAKIQENRQLTLILVLVCTAFLLLANPIYFLLVVYSFVDNKATPHRFAVFQFLKTICEMVTVLFQYVFVVTGTTFGLDVIHFPWYLSCYEEKSVFAFSTSTNLSLFGEATRGRACFPEFFTFFT